MPTEPSPSPGRSSRKWLLAAVLFALLIEVVLLVRSPAVARDGITFIVLARDFAKDPVATMRYADQHPGFLAMILAGRWSVSPLVPRDSVFSWVWGARLASGLFGPLIVVVAWLLAKRAFDDRTAALTAIFVAVLPGFRQSAVDALSDTPHLFLYALAVWLAAEGMVRRRWTWFPAVGAVSALAYWVRPEGLSVVIVLTAVLPLWAWRSRTMSVRKALLCVGVMVLVAAVVSSPYLVLSGKFSGKITSKLVLAPVSTAEPESSPEAPAASGLPAARPPVAAAPTAPPVVEDSRDNPWERAWTAVVQILEKSAHNLRWVLGFPFVVGVFALRRRRADQVPRTLIFTLIVFHFLLLIGLYCTGGYIGHRHLMPAVLLAMPWVGVGTILIGEKLQSLSGERPGMDVARRRRVMLVLLTAGLVAGLLPRAIRPPHARELPAVRTAVWLGQRIRPDDTVLSNSPYVPFYADMSGRVITREETEVGIDLSTVTPPYRYVVLDRRVRAFRPEWPAQLTGRYEPLDVPDVKKRHVETFMLRPTGE